MALRAGLLEFVEAARGATNGPLRCASVSTTLIIEGAIMVFVWFNRGIKNPSKKKIATFNFSERRNHEVFHGLFFVSVNSYNVEFY